MRLSLLAANTSKFTLFGTSCGFWTIKYTELFFHTSGISYTEVSSQYRIPSAASCGKLPVDNGLVQVLMAIVARCCLHTMYEFTAFMNMWAVESLGVSGGVAAQVGTVCWKSCRKPSILSAWSVL